MAQRISACPGNNSRSVSLSLFQDRACSSCRDIESFYALRLKAYPSTLPNLSSQPGAARDAGELRISATVEYFKHFPDTDQEPERIRKDLECSVMVVRFSARSSARRRIRLPSWLRPQAWRRTPPSNGSDNAPAVTPVDNLTQSQAPDPDLLPNGVFTNGATITRTGN